MTYRELATKILELVDGKENVNSVIHCITRLRFKLKDESKAQTDQLEKMDGVVKVLQSGGQYQVVIGNHVPEVYKELTAVGGFSQGEEHQQNDKEGKVLDKAIDMIAGIFTPILSLLVASGMIKGFTSLFNALGWIAEESGTYAILNAVGDALFYFLPIFLGYTAMKKFGGSPFIGMAIGAALLHPTMVSLTEGDPLFSIFTGSVIESPVNTTFLGIPVILMTYSTTVIPILVAAFFATKVERFFSRIIPSVVRTFLVPTFTLITIVPATFLIIGPIATWLSSLLGGGTTWLFDLSPVIAGIFIGAMWQVLIIFGLHWGIVPLAFNNLSTLGYDPILATAMASLLATAGVMLAVLVKANDEKIKALSIPAFISAVFGIVEPAIYGIMLPKKKPFIISCIGGAVGGGITGYFGSKLFVFGGLGVFSYPTYVNPEEGLNGEFWGYVTATIAAFLIGFVITYFFGGVNEKKSPIEEETSPSAAAGETNQKTGDVTIASPLAGQVVPLEDVPEETFSSGAMGGGAAVIPAEGQVVSPVNGVVTTSISSGHAVGITSDEGIEILIHIGIDTVELEGAPFTSHVQQGDRVQAGQLIIECDEEKIRESGYNTITPIIITNQDHVKDITVIGTELVHRNDPLLTVRM
ncbi:beta-glucoside-specific PTS transporter subunit IIABC [Salibacterium qingdaonense]|uniref:PTS system, beta-glucosides-specific IIC component n=1 Tax=Salibacterium qingdaonense TaxID=266892 RepID=A0A1I4NHY5_9BACI|nr:beta-glucoside-specific PTS transporter subunit IIABC [Salibacterium qingdaonense]SFM15071.1 PTS system, beta-glucosides-specific IIC component [Salibacterium qingdaonense]